MGCQAIGCGNVPLTICALSPLTRFSVTAVRPSGGSAARLSTLGASGELGAPVGTRGLEVPRRRHTPLYLRLSAGVLAAALGAPASAQVASQVTAPAAAGSDFPLLAPALDGRSPPVLRRLSPQAQADTVPPPGQLPSFGDQPALGAGATGFNSSTTGSKAAGQSQAPGTATPKPSAAPATTALPPPLPLSAIGDARLRQNQNRTRHGAPGA